MSTFTLAICARNAQDIIGGCLESIAAQTVAPDVVLVAVDEMSDPTVAVAEAHGATVIASGGTGLYEARNAVLAACETEYLGFTDADCVLVPEWVEIAKKVLDEREEIAAGTGRHPPIGVQNFASWLHHMWYVVETEQTGPSSGIIGGNSYFRVSALREVGGWLDLPGHSAAEDVYIAHELKQAGYGIWFQEECAAQHHYETSLDGLWKKAVMMGKDIVVMMRLTRRRDALWWYTFAIPSVMEVLWLGIVLTFVDPALGLSVVLPILVGSYLFFAVKFGNPVMAFPRWVARWILILPYSVGIYKGLFKWFPQDKYRKR